VAQYYYTVASLPFLQYDSDNFPSTTRFLEICVDHVRPDDMILIRNARLDIDNILESSCGVLQRWYDFERGIRNELVKHRSGALSREPHAYLKFDRADRDMTDLSGVSEIVRSAVSETNPMRAEENLQKARWQFLEGLEIGHYFDCETLVLYFLKLQILERKGKMTRENGEKVFEEAYRRISEGFFEEKTEKNITEEQ
jgi:hypothetical protein